MLKGMIKCVKLIARLAIAVIVLAIILIAAAMVKADSETPNIGAPEKTSVELDAPEVGQADTVETASAPDTADAPESAETPKPPQDKTPQDMQAQAVDVGPADPGPEMFALMDDDESDAAPDEVHELPEEPETPGTPEVAAQAETAAESAPQSESSSLSNWPNLKVENELDMLACAIYKEAGGDACSNETRMMVGNVILNRVNHPDFPNTIEEVLVAPLQYNTFEWTGIVWPDEATLDFEHHAVDRAYACAQRLLDGERVFDESVIWQSGEFQGTELVSYQDGIYFCR